MPASSSRLVMKMIGRRCSVWFSRTHFINSSPDRSGTFQSSTSRSKVSRCRRFLSTLPSLNA